MFTRRMSLVTSYHTDNRLQVTECVTVCASILFPVGGVYPVCIVVLVNWK